MALSPNGQGAVWMTLTVAGFVANDVMMKSVSDQVPLFQAIFLRGLVACALVLAVAWASGALRFGAILADRRLIAMRVVGEIGATCLFLTALFNMPIANASAIMQSTTLSLTLAAAVILGERVGWRRALAIAVGFAGVLLIVRPGAEGFNVYSLSALGSVCFITLRDLATRRLNAAVPGLAVTVLTAAAITILGGAVTAVQGWQPVETEAVLRLGTAGVFVLIAYNCGIQAMRVGDVSAVTPFRYTKLLWAMLLGFLVFDEVPGFWTLAGGALIVGAGLFTLWRERTLQHAR